MDSYSIFFKRSAEKELRKVSPPAISQIINKIKALTNQPRPPGAQLLKGEDRYFRIRQGDFGIVYEIDDSQKKNTIIKIGHRREVYDT